MLTGYGLFLWSELKRKNSIRDAERDWISHALRDNGNGLTLMRQTKQRREKNIGNSDVLCCCDDKSANMEGEKNAASVVLT